jgi:hypothetical protein
MQAGLAIEQSAEDMRVENKTRLDVLSCFVLQVSTDCQLSRVSENILKEFCVVATIPHRTRLKRKHRLIRCVELDRLLH